MNKAMQIQGQPPAQPPITGIPPGFNGESSISKDEEIV